MAEKKLACIVYVSATRNRVEEVKGLLEAEGFTVDELELPLQAAEALKGGDPIELDADVRERIQSASVCVFLLPEDFEDFGAIGAGIGVGNAAGIRTVAVLCGGPTNDLPQEVDDLADAVVSDLPKSLIDAVCDGEVWETEASEPRVDRKINRVKCQ